MASNKLPRQLDLLVALAEDAADGLHDHQGPVGIKQNKEADVRADIAATQAAESDYQVKRQTRSLASTEQTAADKTGREFIATAKNVLEAYLGRAWSQAWATAGFINNSTAIPETIDERLSCIGMLRLYFTNNPAHENAPLSITAAQADVVYQALSNKRSAANSAATAVGVAKIARDEALAELRGRMTGLINELAQLLDDDDPLWHSFGLNRPSDPETPEIPLALVVNPANIGHLLANWERAPRADRYRVWRQVVGVDTDFQPVATVTDTDATLNTLASGTAIRVYVTAINDAGESQPSTTVEAVVP